MNIFLCYSRSDEEVVGALVRLLEDANWNIWLDAKFGTGPNWWKTILHNIRSSSVVIFASSEAALSSMANRSELQYAAELNRPIVAVQVGPMPSSEGLGPLVKTIRLRPGDPASESEVISAVQAAFQRAQPLPNPLPPEPQRIIHAAR
jgi:serine/threonine kinase PknH